MDSNNANILTVLNAIAPDVKSQFPPGSIKFVAGATMIPNNGFLEKVIADAKVTIDLVSYHRYVLTDNSTCNLMDYISSNENSFSYVRNYLATQEVPTIPIMISEGAMGYSHVTTETPQYLPRSPRPPFTLARQTLRPICLPGQK